MTNDIAGRGPARNSKPKQRKEQFAPLPIRAAGDGRLSARHFRVMMAIAFHDRFDRNGQGCWAGRDKLAAAAQCSVTHFSDAVSDLRRLGYVVSTPHPMNRRQTVHRVIYEQNTVEHSANDRSRIQDPFESDRSRFREEQVPVENAKSLNGNETRTKNIFYRNIIDNAEAITAEKFVGDLKRDCAEARTSETEKTNFASTAETEAYLSEVETFATDRTTFSALRCEYAKLSGIASDPRLPLSVRDRAARLRDVANAA